EEEEAQASHAPRVAQLHARLPDPHRVQMEEDVRQHYEHAVSVRCRPSVPEDRHPDLRLGQPVPEPFERAFFGCNGLGISHKGTPSFTAVGAELAPPWADQGRPLRFEKCYAFRNASGSIHCPSSYWKCRL